MRDECPTCRRPRDDEWVVWCPISRPLAEKLRGDGLTTGYPVTLRLAADDTIVFTEHYPPPDYDGPSDAD